MARHTIVLMGHGFRKEAKANAAITPGHLLQTNLDGSVQAHASAGGHSRKAFAVENDLYGKGIDTAYASGDTTLYAVFHPGEEVYALIQASGDAVVAGDALQSAGDGTLIKRTGSNSIIAYAMESVDNSAGASAARIRAEVA